MINPCQNKQTFEAFVDKYCDMIYRIAYQNTKSSFDSEDIMQEVFLSLIKSKKLFNDDEHLKAWLIRVTVNKCIDFLKSANKRQNVSIDTQAVCFDTHEKEIMEEIFSLPTDYRNIIYLYYYESYTIAEIAEILGKNKNTINSKLQRARKQLKPLLEKGGYHYERNVQKSS